MNDNNLNKHLTHHFANVPAADPEATLAQVRHKLAQRPSPLKQAVNIAERGVMAVLAIAMVAAVGWFVWRMGGMEYTPAGYGYGEYEAAPPPWAPQDITPPLDIVAWAETRLDCICDTITFLSWRIIVQRSCSPYNDAGECNMYIFTGTTCVVFDRFLLSATFSFEMTVFDSRIPLHEPGNVHIDTHIGDWIFCGEIAGVHSPEISYHFEGNYFLYFTLSAGVVMADTTMDARTVTLPPLVLFPAYTTDETYAPPFSLFMVPISRGPSVFFAPDNDTYPPRTPPPFLPLPPLYTEGWTIGLSRLRPHEPSIIPIIPHNHQPSEASKEWWVFVADNYGQLIEPDKSDYDYLRIRAGLHATSLFFLVDSLHQESTHWWSWLRPDNPYAAYHMDPDNARLIIDFPR